MKEKLEQINQILNQIESIKDADLPELLWAERELQNLINRCDKVCDHISSQIPLTEQFLK